LRGLPGERVDESQLADSDNDVLCRSSEGDTAGVVDDAGQRVLVNAAADDGEDGGGARVVEPLRSCLADCALDGMAASGSRAAAARSAKSLVRGF